jgi:hypothetical protein
MIIEKKVIVARAPVTLKLPVAVTPPCSILLITSLFCGRTYVLNKPSRSKIGTIPIVFANRMKKKNVNISGVQVIVHLEPTFGFTILSLKNFVTISIKLTQPVGTSFLLFKNLLTGIMIEIRTTKDTIQSISTCFVTERSNPSTFGKCNIG